MSAPHNSGARFLQSELSTEFPVVQDTTATAQYWLRRILRCIDPFSRPSVASLLLGESIIEKEITVAVVDDHLMVAEMLSLLVSKESDMRLVGTAHNVADAFALAELEHPVVMLMDYRLPDGDGIEAVKRILEKLPDTRIVMLSGSGGNDLLARAIEAGCVGMLAKDRPAEDVLNAVRSAARGELVFRPDEIAMLMGHLRQTQNSDAKWLTSRELEVLKLLAKGYSTEGIADTLFISTNTVRNHVSKILAKLGAHSKLEAVAIATRDKIVELET